jgi:hypothetical protein
VLTYVIHEKWVNHLFSQLNHFPPPGYANVSLEQILQADIELFTILANECRTGIAADVNGVCPVEVALKQHMFCPQVTYAILPLPTGKSQPGRGKRKSNSEDEDKSSHKKSKGTSKGQSMSPRT